MSSHGAHTAEVSYIRWDPSSFHERHSKVVHVRGSHSGATWSLPEACAWAAEALDLPAWCEKYQEHVDGCRAVIAVLGDDEPMDAASVPGDMSEREAAARAALLCGRGLLAGALEAGAAVLTAGADHGISRLIGLANRDRHHRLPLIAVARAGEVTWPGDPRPEQAAPARQPVRLPLQSDHTHAVLAEDAAPGGEEAGAGQLRAELCRAMASGAANAPVGAARGAPPRPLPRVAIVVGGGAAARAEALHLARMNWPLCAVQGTGGLADQIAEATKRKGAAAEGESRDRDGDRDVCEMVELGAVETVDFALMDSGMMKTMIKQLCSLEPDTGRQDDARNEMEAPKPENKRHACCFW